MRHGLVSARRFALVCGLVGMVLAAAPQARELRVGVYENPTKISLDSKGRPSGIFGDLLAEIARREGWTVVAVPCKWEACLALLERGELDLMPDVASSEQRARRFDFHRIPALHSWSQIYRAPDTVANSMRDLDGHRIAVLGGSVQETYLRELIDGFGLDIALVPEASFDAAFAAVAAGQADAAAANHHFGNREAARSELVETPIMFLPSQLYFAVPKGRHRDLLDAIDRHLERWRLDAGSPYFEVLRRWGAPEPARVVPAWLLQLLAAAGVLLLFSAVGLGFLRREVSRRTARLRASEERLATILDSVDAYIFIKDREGRYQYVNQKAAELLGRSPAQLVGVDDGELFHAENVPRIRADDRRVLDHGERVAAEETLQLAASGREVLVYSIKLPLYDAKRRIHALCGIATDLTEQRRLHQELASIALYDPLTRLPNRRHLLEQLETALEDCADGVRSGALVMLDIARFKELNDSRGHDAGDSLLRAIAERLLPVLPDNALLARMGADEFAVLVRGVPGAVSEARQAAARLAQGVHETLGSPFMLLGERHVCQAHLGVAVFSGLQDSAPEVLRQADLALTEAKSSSGEGPRFFRPELQSMATARAALESDLRAGIEARQFLLHYQPQVGGRGELVGLEALVRWQHPQRGMVSPASFIPLAEASGLILPLGRWILRSACQQLVQATRDWPDERSVMSVNVSARQLHGPQFVDEVLAIVSETGAPPERIELELTESLLLEDLEGAIGKLTRLKDFGLRLALDDFGTGYSSLGYLKRLPLDQLKIDVVFVRDLLFDPNDMAIVRTIIGLGRSLDLEVLAEGVETEAQRDILAELGCHRYQGYLFSKPKPFEELAGWFAPK